MFGAIFLYHFLCFYFSNGDVVKKASKFDLKPQIATLDIWSHFVFLFSFSTFLPGSKMVEKVDLEASRCDLKPQIYWLIWTSGAIFLYFSALLLFYLGVNGWKSWSGGLQMSLQAPNWSIWISGAINKIYRNSIFLPKHPNLALLYLPVS